MRQILDEEGQGGSVEKDKGLGFGDQGFVLMKCYSRGLKNVLAIRRQLMVVQSGNEAALSEGFGRFGSEEREDG